MCVCPHAWRVRVPSRLAWGRARKIRWRCSGWGRCQVWALLPVGQEGPACWRVLWRVNACAEGVLQGCCAVEGAQWARRRVCSRPMPPVREGETESGQHALRMNVPFFGCAVHKPRCCSKGHLLNGQHCSRAGTAGHSAPATKRCARVGDCETAATEGACGCAKQLSMCYNDMKNYGGHEGCLRLCQAAFNVL